jgi:hypothetical protein
MLTKLAVEAIEAVLVNKKRADCSKWWHASPHYRTILKYLFVNV